MTRPRHSPADNPADPADATDHSVAQSHTDGTDVPSLRRSAVVVIVDRLSAAYLGSYGNTWLETPELNRIASQSLLFEFAMTNSPHLEDVYRAYWWGRLASSLPLSPGSLEGLPSTDPPPPFGMSLPEMVRGLGVFTCLVTDEPRVAELAAESAFDQTVFVETDHGPSGGNEKPFHNQAVFLDGGIQSYGGVDFVKGAYQPARDQAVWIEANNPPFDVNREAEDIFQTQISQVFAAALETLESLPRPYLLWIHLRGMEGPWDAPYSLRLSLAEDEDPDPPAAVDPPQLVLEIDEDPDTRWGYMRAYGGQILALDACGGLFSEALRKLEGSENTLVMWTSPRGYPLGDHREIGSSSDGLYSESLHVPWWISLPDGAAAAARCTSLVHPPDMAATLVDWWELNDVSPPELTRLGNSLLPKAEAPDRGGSPYIVSAADGMLAVRSQSWLATRLAGDPWQLYAKPDDRFEANEVSGRCRPVVEALESWMSRYLDSAARQFTSLPCLPDLLARDSDRT